MSNNNKYKIRVVGDQTIRMFKSKSIKILKVLKANNSWIYMYMYIMYDFYPWK